MSECFKSFTYDGKSTETIISPVKLMLATFDGISSVTGVSREIQKGGTTITRPVANEYGTVANNATIEYCLIKSDYEPFTEQEQRIVERWLTSPKFSADMVVYDTDDEEVCIYRGLFTNTSWIPHSRGYAGVQFTFECNTAYPFKKYKKDYTVAQSETITLNCESDELNEYVYPVLTVMETSETAYVRVINKTDNDNVMNIRALDRLKTIFDCKHCIPTDETRSGVISYADLGWDDVGNIYWLRLLPGENQLEIHVSNKNVNEETGEISWTDIDSSAEISISYECPYKLVGGWL